MKISKLLADDAILTEIGERVARRRLDLQLTQAEMAEQAGVAKRTVERIEAGASAQMSSIIRILRVRSVAGSGSHDPRGRAETDGFTKAQRAKCGNGPQDADVRIDPIAVVLGWQNMSTVAEVRLWGRTIGAVSLEEGDEVAAFEYDPAFVGSGIEISPLTMPLSNRVYTFPELSRKTFYGLPGLLADSLPDKFGHVLIDAWLATQGRRPDSFNVVERLCYTGERGMGALEFAPATGPKARQASRIQIDKLVELASEILTHRNNLQVSFADKSREQALTDIRRVGTSAGGARAKAVIAWNPSTNEVRSGQIPAGAGFEYWLLKFDGVTGNKDKELEDPQGYGVIEYAYYKMARTRYRYQRMPAVRGKRQAALYDPSLRSSCGWRETPHAIALCTGALRFQYGGRLCL